MFFTEIPYSGLQTRLFLKIDFFFKYGLFLNMTPSRCQMPGQGGLQTRVLNTCALNSVMPPNRPENTDSKGATTILT